MHHCNLVWVTPAAEHLIGKMARVSNPANQDNPDVTKLIRYLIRHKHWSPFEMVNMCLEVNTTRAIAAQVLRHRSFSFQEFSQRYAPAMELVIPELRRQDSKNRQNSTDDLDPMVIEFCTGQIEKLYRDADAIYEYMLNHDVAKECARAVLPLNTATKLYMSGTVRSWLHYCDLRRGNGTQKEHMQIADSAYHILKSQLPLVSSAMWPEATGHA